MKRVISLLLVCCFLGLALVACGGNKEKVTETAKPTETQMQTDMYGQEALAGKVDWNTLDFEGETIYVIVRNDEKVSREWEKEDVGDDELDLAIQNRNDVVENAINLNVEIELVANSEISTVSPVYTTLISQDIDNDLHEFDIAAHYAYVATSLGLRDYHVNLLDSDTLPYFNFGLKCWNQAIVNNTQANGQLYFVSGDLNLSLFDASMIIWHNKDLYEKVRKDDDPEDIQDLIIAGDWTYSELYKWSQYYSDTDGNSQCGDVYGVRLEGTYIVNPNDALPYAWDLDIVKTNSNGTHSYNIIGNAKISEAMTSYRQMFNAEGNAHGVTCTCGSGGHFVDGDRLFNTDVLFWDKASNLAIREMKDKYALLPWPKYDETQDHYATTSQDYFTTMAVIDHSQSPIPTKGNEISAYLQYATEYSYTNVRMFYFKEIVEPKYFGNFTDGTTKKSVAIFNTIINNLEYDFATIYSPMLEGILSTVWKNTVHNGGTLEQKYNANKKAYEDALKSLDEWFGLK